MNDYPSYHDYVDYWEVAEAAKVARDKANDALVEAWDLEVGPVATRVPPADIERLRLAALEASDKYDDAKREAVAAWKRAGSPLESSVDDVHNSDPDYREGVHNEEGN